MGAYRSKPDMVKSHENSENDRIRFASCTMQGWRIHQEDAHNCIIDFMPSEVSMFAVYDGHGGREVAEFLSLKFPDFLKSQKIFDILSADDANDLLEDKIDSSLRQAFVQFDATLLGMDEIAQMTALKEKEEPEQEDVEKKTEDEEEREELIEEAMALSRESSISLETIIKRYTKYKNFLISNQSAGDDENLLKKCGGEEEEVSEEVETEESEISSRRVAKRPVLLFTSPPQMSKRRKTNNSSSDEVTDNDQNNETNTANCKTKEEEEGGQKQVEEGGGKQKAKFGVKASNEEGVEEQKKEELGLEENTLTTQEEENNKEKLNGEEMEKKEEEPRTKEKREVKSDVEVLKGQIEQEENSSKVIEKESQKVENLEGELNGGKVEKEGVEGGEPKPCSSSCGASSSGSSLATALLAVGESAEDDEEDDSDFKIEDELEPADESSDAEEEEEEEETENEEEVMKEEGVEDEEEDDSLDGDDLKALMMSAAAEGNARPGFDSGSTACVAFVLKDKIIVANVGDSRAVLCRAGKALELSSDHKPEDEAERERIISAGGTVSHDGRVNGGLNLSRAFGDHFYKQNAALPLQKQQIIAVPDVTCTPWDVANDEFLVIACDGIWNTMSSQQVCDFVAERIANTGLKEITAELCDHCCAKDTSGDGSGNDNETVILIDLKKNEHAA